MSSDTLRSGAGAGFGGRLVSLDTLRGAAEWLGTDDVCWDGWVRLVSFGTLRRLARGNCRMFHEFDVVFMLKP